MADVGITVAVGGDARGFEAAINKARALGKGWADQFKGQSSAAASQTERLDGAVGKVGKSIGTVGRALGGLPGPVQQLAGSVGNLLDVFKSGAVSSGFTAVLAGVTAIAAVAKSIGQVMEDTASRALEYTDALVKRQQKAQAEYRALRPDIFDPFGERVRTATESKDTKSLRSLSAEKMAEAQSVNVRLQEGKKLQAAGQGVDMVRQAEDQASFEKARAEAKRLADLAKKMDEDAAQEAKARADKAEKDRLAQYQQDAAAAVSANRSLLESRRQLAISRAPSQIEADKMRIRFLGEDYRSAAQTRANAPMGSAERTTATAEMVRLLAAATDALKDIRKNTESSKQ